MKIKYLNSHRLYYAFLAGGNAVIEDKDYLNKINVFPVPDADTGTNLAATMHSIAEGTEVSKSIRKTFRSIADAALHGARGNSGLIFAQFIHGLSREIKNDLHLTPKSFGESVKAAVQYLHQAIVSPVEGTMLTVIRDWADSVYHQRMKTGDFLELLSHSLQVARKSLRDTPKKLAVLAKAGVVDAGAKGFVDFIEGILNFIKIGKLRNVLKTKLDWVVPESPKHSFKSGLKERYCAEALMIGRQLDVNTLREHIRSFGDSVIVAGSEEKVRFHVHTDKPADLFHTLQDFGSFTQIKVDDMLKQYQAGHNRKAKIALVTDSSCDLHPEVIDEHQIHVIPFQLSFGDTLFLDKLTITPQQFCSLLKTHPEHPKTSQPGIPVFEHMFSFLTTFYESVIVFHISGGLSGTFDFSRKAAEKFRDKKITVIDSKNLSVSLALIVLRAAEAVRDGKSHDEIVKLAEEWIAKTRVFVDICTLKFLVRGGRVSPIKGLVAKLLNIKPLITLNEQGKAEIIDKSFTRKGNMKKIIAACRKMAAENKVWNYGIVHAQNIERAELYRDELKEVLGKEPAFIQDVSPVVAAHNGLGVVGVAVMAE